MAIMDPNRRLILDPTNPKKRGRFLQNADETMTDSKLQNEGPLMTGGASAPQSAGGLAGLYGNILQGYQQATDVNIEGARTTAALEQERLNRQLEQQRQDYLKNRQTLQKETFLRGRNVLANLANRGLATSGLQQLGDVQRTIATGQQMNELSQAFERAREGLSAQQTQVATGLQQYEGQQRAALGQQAAALGLQEYRDVIQDKERSVAYAESLATLLKDPNIAQEVKDALSPLYEALISTPGVSDTGGTGGTGEPGGPGSLAEALNVDIPAQKTQIQLASDILNNVGGEGMFSTFEQDKLKAYINKSENLAPDSEFRKALSQIPEGTIPEISVQTKDFKAGLNDTYEIIINGNPYQLEGKELATLIMTGEIQVDPAIAVSIVQLGGGNITSQLGTLGNEDDAFVSTMLNWLRQQGYLDGNKINRELVPKPLRGK